MDGIGSSSGYKEEGYGNDPEAKERTNWGIEAIGGGCLIGCHWDVEYSRNGHGKHRTCRG